MKKVISVLMCLVLVGCVFAGCVKKEDMQSDIVLITDGATITDKGYNQSAWEGVTAYADEEAMTCRYYQPALEDGKLTSDCVEKYISIASENGAKFVVLPGEAFAVIAYELAPLYPAVNFILLDAIPHSADNPTDRFISNVMSVSFDALQSGFLAGYISVINGNTELGFFGEFDSKTSATYGAGFVQGAAYAADTLGKPVTLDWADYDSALVDYDYDFTITACYQKVSDVKEKTFNVKVENGIGTGTYKEGSNVTITADPAPIGQVFDHWDIKSNTDGVKDKKVNVSSKTASSMNLLVEKCDCTLTAVYKDIDGDYVTVSVLNPDAKTANASYSVSPDGKCDITAPVAPEDKVFDHWECNIPDAVEDINAKSTKIAVGTADVVLTPVYVESEAPTFNVTVVTGEGGSGDSLGAGSYVAGDWVDVKAAIPQEGYMFSHWENVDAYGNSTGIAMDNEYYWNTGFEMVDRYAAVCETMYNHGVSTIFNGGNARAQSAFTAKWNYDYNLNVITAGANNKDAYTTIVNNYGEAIKNCLADFKGGSVYAASCANDCIYATYVADDEKLQAQYDAVYKALADGTISPVRVQGSAGFEFCRYFNENKMSKCLTLNGIFIEGLVFTADK